MSRGVFVMNKIMISLLILGLMALSACGSKTNVAPNTASDTNGVQNIVSDNKNVAPVNNNVEKITDVQKTENIGKSVTVEGKVINTLQSARYGISGYKIQDSTGTISVSSKKLPKVNDTVKVTGVLAQSRYFGIIITEAS
jgi:hypothetical protein